MDQADAQFNFVLGQVNILDEETKIQLAHNIILYMYIGVLRYLGSYIVKYDRENWLKFHVNTQYHI